MVFLTKASLLALLSIISLSTAHSPSWPTITYSESIQSLHHDILPQNPQHQQQRQGDRLNKRRRRSDNNNSNDDDDDSFIVLKDDIIRLHLSAFNQTFHLHLEPNHDLIHPELNLSGHHDDEIKAFKGVVVQDEGYSQRKWQRSMTVATSSRSGSRNTVEHMLHEEGVLGWARMMIEYDDRSGSMVLRGAFTANGDTFHVTSREHYHIQKRSDDHIPSPSPSSTPELIIYRNSDLYKHKHTKRQNSSSKRSSTSCGAEKILNNTQTPLSFGYYYPPSDDDLTSSLMASSGTAGLFPMSMLLQKRDTPPISIKVAAPNPIPTGCPSERKVNYMGVAADCTYVRTYGGENNARKQILADFNTASGIYESTFNVALGIRSMQIESMNCPSSPVSGQIWNQECSTNYTINNRLSDFSYWRGQDGRNDDGIGLWHLLTKCNSGSILGIAWTKALCQTSAEKQGSGAQTQYNSGAGVSSISPNEWMIVAHEVGHGFGANHDCTASSCVSSKAISEAACCPLSQTTCDANDKYIMNPYEQAVTNVFSPCSINSICSTIASQGTCLQVPTALANQSYASSVCGNGIREEGEQCDCGTPEECANDPCCDGTTCKFKGSAVCDDLNDDCCKSCQFAPVGQVCRSAVSNDCDYAETCTGTSAACPNDAQVPDLTPCQILSDPTGNNSSSVIGSGQCASGLCTSRDYQCAQQQRPGITHQCGASTSGCELLCNGPNTQPNTCMKIPGAYFIDGTPCGSSGTCSSGQCVSAGGHSGSNHLGIILPVVIVGVLLIVGIVLWMYCVRRKRTRTKVSNAGGSFNIKEVGTMVDVPKWMIAGDRRSSHAMPSKTGMISFTSQKLPQNSQGSFVQTPTPPAATHVQPSLRERANSTQFDNPSHGGQDLNNQVFRYCQPNQYQGYSQSQCDEQQQPFEQQHNRADGYM